MNDSGGPEKPDAGFVGRDVRALTDVAGMNFGTAFYETAVAGEFNTVEYLWPRPGGTEPMPKASYVTIVGGQMCGVGYYP